jgi:hypothetical protein
MSEFGQTQFEDGEHAIWNDKLTGECGVPDEAIWKSYQENLQMALNYVEILTNEVSGKTIITSDHGQAIGDRAYPIPYREYGHPGEMYIPSLTKVPWFICEWDDRREITKENSQTGYPDQNRERKEDTMHNQLEALGYR